MVKKIASLAEAAKSTEKAGLEKWPGAVHVLRVGDAPSAREKGGRR